MPSRPRCVNRFHDPDLIGVGHDYSDAEALAHQLERDAARDAAYRRQAERIGRHLAQRPRDGFTQQYVTLGRRRTKPSPTAIAVWCVEAQRRFPSMMAAGAWAGKHFADIAYAIKRGKLAGGFHWVRFDPSRHVEAAESGVSNVA